MNEDPVLAALVSDALRADGPFEFRLPRRRPVLPWAMSSLLAASVAVVVALQVWMTPTKTDVLSETIAFLSEADGVEIEAGDPSEMLLAWQEAPLWL